MLVFIKSQDKFYISCSWLSWSFICHCKTKSQIFLQSHHILIHFTEYFCNKICVFFDGILL